MIPDGAVISARAFVTKDIPPYEIWGGNPAKKIKGRFGDNIIKELLKIQWWNWDDKKIFKNRDIICSADIDRLHDFV